MEQGLTDYTIQYRCTNCNNDFSKKFKRGTVAPKKNVECPMCSTPSGVKSFTQPRVNLDADWISKRKQWPEPMVIIPPVEPRPITPWRKWPLPNRWLPPSRPLWWDGLNPLLPRQWPDHKMRIGSLVFAPETRFFS